MFILLVTLNMVLPLRYKTVICHNCNSVITDKRKSTGWLIRPIRAICGV